MGHWNDDCPPAAGCSFMLNTYLRELLISLLNPQQEDRNVDLFLNNNDDFNLDFPAESQPMKDSAQPSHVSVPAIPGNTMMWKNTQLERVTCHIHFIHPYCFYSPEEEWRKLLELSPLFQLLKGVQLQLKGWACGAGLVQGELAGRLDTVESTFFFVE